MFLKLKIQDNLTPAKIRDRWNQEHPEDVLSTGQKGSAVVKQGIKSICGFLKKKNWKPNDVLRDRNDIKNQVLPGISPLLPSRPSPVDSDDNAPSRHYSLGTVPCSRLTTSRRSCLRLNGSFAARRVRVGGKSSIASL